jgi:hypothetical protein
VQLQKKIPPIVSRLGSYICITIFDIGLVGAITVNDEIDNM